MSIPVRAERLVKEFYAQYSDAVVTPSTQNQGTTRHEEATSSRPIPKSIFTSAIFSQSTSPVLQEFESEIKLYFSGAYPIRIEDNDKMLEWWKVCNV